MGVFFTIYFAMMFASPPAAGWILDRTGTPDGAIMYGALLFGLVFPAAIAFGTLKSRAMERLVLGERH
jgi:MFS family permease